MAGGVGSRFWPLSTQEFPKQFHDMLGKGQSLIQRTFERINSLIPSENMFIATNKEYEHLVLEQLKKTSKEQLLLEPVMRNTAPCILYAALKIFHQNPDGVMLIAPSDHWIEKEEEFLRSIQTAFAACSENDILMTLGIQPDAPHTGYGYIQFESDASEIKRVRNFTEKPDIETAQQFLSSRDYLWNAGIFVWSVQSILKAFRELLPEMYELFDVENQLNTEKEVLFMEENYPKAANISIDFGIMEKATNVRVLPVDFGWNDLGTWGSLYHKLDKDGNMNATVNSKNIFRDAHGNMIRTQLGKRVVIQGLHDFIVVEKDDVLLICPRKDEQEIKQIVTDVKENFGSDFV